MRQFRWHEQFHGIPCNLKCANYADTSSSMECHGIPWNLECANFADTSSSMEFHGTSCAPILLTRAILWNLGCAHFDNRSSYMEFHGTRSAPISMTQAVPWNSMELRMRQLRWHEQFHGIPWNSMELAVSQFRWHEQLHGIPWNSIELEVRQFRWHEQFHGIPCYLECANFADRSSSMEFHGTWNAPISMTRAVPWNSVKLGMRQFLVMKYINTLFSICFIFTFQ